MIVAFLGQDHRDWDMHVKELRFAFNTSTHSSTKHSPAFLNFGREPLAANTSKQLLEKGMRIEPLDHADWARRVSRIRAIRGWVAEYLN